MGELILHEDLNTLDLSDLDSGERLAPVPPGDILRLDFMEPLGISATALAKRAGIPTNRITGILHGDRRLEERQVVVHEPLARNGAPRETGIVEVGFSWLRRDAVAADDVVVRDK